MSARSGLAIQQAPRPSLPFPMSETGPKERERYFLNAEADFYVENGVCLCCMNPEIEAPVLMDFSKAEMHCYFKRQPLTERELECAIAAVASSDIQGLRYAANDKSVLDKLVELGAADCCDALTSKKQSGLSQSRIVRLALWMKPISDATSNKRWNTLARSKLVS